MIHLVDASEWCRAVERPTREERRLWEHTDGSALVTRIQGQRGFLFTDDVEGRLSPQENWKLIMDAAQRVAKADAFTEAFCGWRSGQESGHQLGAFVPFSRAGTVDTVRAATRQWHEQLIALEDETKSALASGRRDVIVPQLGSSLAEVERALTAAGVPFRYVARGADGKGVIVHGTPAVCAEIGTVLDLMETTPIERRRSYTGCIVCDSRPPLADVDGGVCRHCTETVRHEVRQVMNYVGNAPQSVASLCLEVTMGGRVVCKTPKHPKDVEEFGQCVNALTAVPAWRSRLYFMAEVSAEWASLLRSWNTVEDAFLEIGEHPRRCVSLLQDAVFWPFA